jgi:hypothetical protein
MAPKPATSKLTKDEPFVMAVRALRAAPRVVTPNAFPTAFSAPDMYEEEDCEASW